MYFWFTAQFLYFVTSSVDFCAKPSYSLFREFFDYDSFNPDFAVVFELQNLDCKIYNNTTSKKTIFMTIMFKSWIKLTTLMILFLASIASCSDDHMPTNSAAKPDVVFYALSRGIPLFGIMQMQQLQLKQRWVLLVCSQVNLC